jgi:hypothetical protein
MSLTSFQQFMIAWIVINSILSISINGACIVYIKKVNKLKKKRSRFVSSDILLISFFVTSIVHAVCDTLAILHYFQIVDCKYVAFTETATINAHLLHILMLSLHRYVLIKCPALFTRINHKNKDTICACVLLWCVGFGAASLPLFGFSKFVGRAEGVCTLDWKDVLLRSRIYIAIYFFIFMLCPLCGIVYSFLVTPASATRNRIQALLKILSSRHGRNVTQHEDYFRKNSHVFEHIFTICNLGNIDVEKVIKSVEDNDIALTDKTMMHSCKTNNTLSFAIDVKEFADNDATTKQETQISNECKPMEFSPCKIWDANEVGVLDKNTNVNSSLETSNKNKTGNSNNKRQRLCKSSVYENTYVYYKRACWNILLGFLLVWLPYTSASILLYFNIEINDKVYAICVNLAKLSTLINTFIYAVSYRRFPCKLPSLLRINSEISSTMHKTS